MWNYIVKNDDESEWNLGQLGGSVCKWTNGSKFRRYIKQRQACKGQNPKSDPAIQMRNQQDEYTYIGLQKAEKIKARWPTKQSWF